jgi:hypothetical protein
MSADMAISPIPSNAREALHDPNWRRAMEVEFSALQANRTWHLVDKPASAHIIFGKWVFKHKLNPDGSLERYKARWVVHGFNQRASIDFQETFTPVIMPATIRTVLTIAASKRWPTRQLDVSNVFLHDNLEEYVLCQQPTRFHDAEQPQAICLLDKSLYRLHQVPRSWFTRFANFAVKLGFKATRSDSSLFVLRRGHDVAYLLLYVDDMVITASSSSLLQRVITELPHEFTIKDMGELRFFLSIDVQRRADGFYLS